MKEYIESGLEWVIITGQLGTELWAGQAVLDLKKEYPSLQLGVLLAHAGFADNWNENNRSVFDHVTAGADYVNYTSSQEYQNPGQLKGNQEFVLKKTDGSLLFYDSDHEGKPKYLLDMIAAYHKHHKYALETISFDEIQEFVTEYEEIHREES